MTNYVIGVDLGGTHLRAALVDETGQIIEQLKRKTMAELGVAGVINRLAEAVQEVLSHLPPQAQVLGVGAIAPGPLDPFNGIVYQAPNLLGWENVPLADELHQRLQLPVWIGNDANLAALAEHRFGAGRGYHHIIYITVSTGIGGGIIVDNRLLLGSRGLAAEVGHMQIVPDGPRCGCGNRGCVEALASGPNIASEAAARLTNRGASMLQGLDRAPTTEEVVQAAREGDILALDVLARAGEFIGMAMANLVHLFNPQRFILGGGVSNAGEMLFGPIRQTTQARTMSAYHSTFDVVPAALGDEVGVLGAAALALSMAS
ncbi:MAG: ROK family protein [Ardenticatenales bacterium]|nr:ROK family protein [Ardenticatenales bacterium]